MSAVLQETWLISEYCDKGNLDRAVLAGRFHDKDTKKPNLVRQCLPRLCSMCFWNLLSSVGSPNTRTYACGCKTLRLGITRRLCLIY